MGSVEEWKFESADRLVAARGAGFWRESIGDK